MSKERRGDLSLSRIIAMRSSELQRLYREIFGGSVPGGSTEHARRRIAWQLQAADEGGLPESIRQHALGIARNQRLLRVVEQNRAKRAAGMALPHAVSARVLSDHDSRTPLPGSVLVKDHGNKTHIVHVLDSGFEYRGERFSSLSSVANRISGSRWNGYIFFGLQKAGSDAR